MKRIALISLVLVVSFVSNAFAGGSKEDDGAMKGSEPAMEQEGGMDKDSGSMMMSSLATRTEFTSLEDAEMYAESGPTVLFFVDDSTESKTAEMTIDNNFTQIPPNTTLITVPFTNMKLRDQFGVTKPGTFVLIDTMGSAVSSWTGGTIDEFNRMLMKDEEQM